MKQTLLILTGMLMYASAFAQVPTVVFDEKSEQFNGGLPLPAETYFNLQGELDSGVIAVRFSILSDNGNNTLYQQLWKKRESGTESFFIPARYKLRPSSEYDFLIEYFRIVTPPEKAELKESLRTLFDNYLQTALQEDRKKLRIFKKNEQQLVDDLNTIAHNALQYYEVNKGTNFDGFSDLVTMKLESVSDLKKDKDENNDNLLTEKRENLLGLLMQELQPFINSDLLIYLYQTYLDNYPVEKGRNTLTLNVGYSYTRLNRDAGNSDFDGGFSAGLAFPLGRRFFSGTFWSNTAVVAGVFFQDFETESGLKISGPVIDMPTYAGLGYSVFRFLRINAGVVFLQDEAVPVGSGIEMRDDFYVRPFVGISADINLWIGLKN